MSNGLLSTGVDGLDEMLNGGLRDGDNVVWEADSGAPVEIFIRSFLHSAEQAGRHLVYVSFGRSPQAILSRYDQDISFDRFMLVDCFTSGKGNSSSVFSDFYSTAEGQRPFPTVIHVTRPQEPGSVREALEKLESAAGQGALYVFDSITGMLELWSDDREVLDFFAYMCPRLYDLNTLAYWMLEKEAHAEQFLAKLRHITQIVIELAIPNGRPTALLRKAERRRSPRIGVAQPFSVEDGTARFAPRHREELEMAILSEISEAIGGALELEKVFEQTMEILARELAMKRGTLVLLDKMTGKLRIAATYGLTRQERLRGTYQIGEGVTGRVVQTGQPVAIADISKDASFLNRTGARTREADAGPISFVCVPLRVDDEVVGAISVDRDLVDEPTLTKDRRLLQIIASLVSQAIKINRMVMVEREQLQAENLRLRKNLRAKYKFHNIVAESGPMQDVLATAAAVAKSDATVLIRGETGTGKELIASVLHYNSDRANGPFIKVNCGALSEGLLESELFGHMRGAFTGAVEDHKGRFELAHKGTIFLDEVGSMGEALQVKLLRVLQEKQFERVGGTEAITTDVRVVAATNVDLEDQIAKGAFRQDLYYRLNVIPILIPPLRQRAQDIPFLVEHFLEKYGQKYRKTVTKMSREVLDALVEYPWPGNVRELESSIERAVVLSTDGSISVGLLPISIRSGVKKERAYPAGPPQELLRRLVQGLLQEQPPGAPGDLYERVIRQVEAALVAAVLEGSNFVQSRAAEQLGLSRNTLRKKMKQHHIRPD